MEWKEVKKFCKKYNIELGFNSIRFSQIPATKPYFERRPKWDVFEYSGETYKHDGSSLMNMERYCWTSTGRKTIKAPIFFYKPPELTSVRSYDIQEFLEKGKIPSAFFRRWTTEPIPIYSVNDMEKAYSDLLKYLSTCKALQDSADLKNYTKEFQQKQAELERLHNEIADIRKKYKLSFCKQAGIANDF
jgi:hypothetical protein